MDNLPEKTPDKTPEILPAPLSILDPSKVIIPAESEQSVSHTTIDGRVLEFRQTVRKARFRLTRRLTQRAAEKFLLSLSDRPNVRRACRIAGVAHRTMYELRRSDPAFDAMWKEAESLGIEHILEVMQQAAIEGDIEPVVSKGQIVTYVRKRDYKVAMWLMERLDPDRFAPRQKVEHSGEIVHFHFDVALPGHQEPTAIDVESESATIPQPLHPDTHKQEQTGQ